MEIIRKVPFTERFIIFSFISDLAIFQQNNVVFISNMIGFIQLKLHFYVFMKQYKKVINSLYLCCK